MNDFFTRYADKIAAPDKRGCRVWNGARTTAGYGHGHRDGEHFYAHRAAYVCAKRRRPKIVRHRCDNPPCCEPSHLVGGTQRENTNDSVRRGRANRARGARAPKTKLTIAAVRKIRRAFERGDGGPQIARRFGVANDTVYAIRDRRTWAWL